MAIFKFCFVRQNVPKLSNNWRPLFPRILPSNSPIEFIPSRFYEFDANIFGCSAKERPTGNADLEAQKAFLRQNVEEKSIKSLVNAFRRFGHLKAKIDPLGLVETERILELEPEIYGFDEESLQKPLQEGGQATMTDMIEHLEELYAGNMAVEFMHLQNPEERQFFAKIYEEMAREEIGPKEKIGALEGMLKMKTWENFVALKFPTLKRYSGEGAESMFAFYRQLLEECPKYEISEIIWGGAHRGRIALQTVLFKFPAGQIFRKMRGLRELPKNVEGMGDVLTHLHSHLDYEAGNGELVHLSTLPNPSHLEASISAVVGKARGRAQTMRVGDYGGGIVGDAILPIHHHGDGAFTGQGIVWETLAMSQVPNFRVGGSIHLIVNNQLAFTADRRIGRSSRHCTDVAKAIDCPVIHVNAENIEKAILAAKIALAYRHRFRKEIFVELVAYRKYGHNELDDPRITQPKMYRSVDAKKCLVEKFGEKLEEENLLEKEKIEKMVEEYKEELKRELELVDKGKTEAKVDHFGGYWQGFGQAKKEMSKWDTGVNAELLKFIGAKSVEIPREFIVHPNVQRTHIEGRRKRIKADEIDWSTAEAMAIGSALLQGFDVRLSGQDVGRATFSHRHAMLVCQQTDRVHIPLNHLNEGQNSFVEIANSPLSEASVLGFEYGFSIEHPKRLTIWEAQFGDFYNGAQIQIDTLIASGESKWLLQNGLVLILPHGFDGAGPDHSSAHIERFLALTDSGEGQSPPDGDNVNMVVAQPTNSAQYFHLLRRQIVTPFRKPLVIISPKLLLRHPSTICPFSNFAEGTTFKSVLKDPKVGDPKKVKKLILCSGKHAVTLMEEREKRRIESDGMAIVRVEGICPFPVDELSEMFGEYSNAKNIIWSQEEPRNAGCWPFVQPRMKNAFGIQLEYCGRPELAWMATPIAEVHKREIDDVLNSTFSSS